MIRSFDEQGEGIGKLKIVSLLIVLAFCSVALFRLYYAPPPTCVSISINYIIYRSGLLSTDLSVKKETTVANGTLNLWQWVLLG